MDLISRIKKTQYFAIDRNIDGVVYISDGLIIQLCEHEILRKREIQKITWRIENFPECLLILGKILFKNSVSERDSVCIRLGRLLDDLISEELANIKIKVLLSSDEK